MLLFVVIIYDPSLILITSVEEDFYLFLAHNQIFSVSGSISPLNVEMSSISPYQAYPFRCWFSNNSVITFLEG